jgi:hypothetical protein
VLRSPHQAAEAAYDKFMIDGDKIFRVPLKVGGPVYEPGIVVTMMMPRTSHTFSLETAPTPRS